MLRTILLRLALAPPVLLAANFAGFTLAKIVALRGGSWLGFGPEAPGQAGGPSPGLLLGEYGQYLAAAVRGDFGQFPYGGTSTTVASLVAGSAVASLGLIGLALLLSVGIGMLLGLAAVRVQPPGVASWLTAFSTIGPAMPGFYLSSLFISGTLLLIVYTPLSGAIFPIGGFGWDSHLVLPVLVLMLAPTARVAQTTASLLAGELGKQYVIAARSFGHTWRRIVWHQAMRNIVAGIIITIAGTLRLLVGELIIVEQLFNWPGLGRMVALSVAQPDLSSQATAVLYLNAPILAALLTTFALLFLVGDLVAAVLVRAYDPRLRER